MSQESALRFRTIRRIAKLWGVPPYRVDVDVDMVNYRIRAFLDGKAPDPEKLALLTQDVLESTKNMRRLN